MILNAVLTAIALVAVSVEAQPPIDSPADPPWETPWKCYSLSGERLDVGYEDDSYLLDFPQGDYGGQRLAWVNVETGAQWRLRNKGWYFAGQRRLTQRARPVDDEKCGRSGHLTDPPLR